LILAIDESKFLKQITRGESHMPVPEYRNPSRYREPRSGRPSTNPVDVKFFETDLHQLLVKKLAKVSSLYGLVRFGRIDTLVMAKKMHCSRQSVYRWLGENKISSRAAKKIIKISEGNVTQEDLTPFLFS